MRQPLRLVLMGVAVAGAACVGPRTWTAPELARWHHEWSGISRSSNALLWYRGSDDEYHYFMSRPIDSWVLARVQRKEIALVDIRPYYAISSDPFPGYYAVDAQHEFSRLAPPDGGNQ